MDFCFDFLIGHLRQRCIRENAGKLLGPALQIRNALFTRTALFLLSQNILGFGDALIHALAHEIRCGHTPLRRKALISFRLLIRHSQRNYHGGPFGCIQIV